MCVCVCLRVYMKACSLCQKTASIALPSYSLMQGLSIKPRAPDIVSLPSQLALGNPLTLPSHAGIMGRCSAHCKIVGIQTPVSMLAHQVLSLLSHHYSLGAGIFTCV